MKLRHALAAAFLTVAVGGVAAAAGNADPSVPTSTTLTSSPTIPGLKLVQVGSFTQPDDVVGAPADESRLFVVQRGGQIALVLNGHVQARPFLDLSKQVNTRYWEQGLLGLAFPSHYATSGLFYVSYVLPNDDIRIAQFQRSKTNPNVANPASAKTVLTIRHRATYDNDNGGEIMFGPDGDLYISAGDGDGDDDPLGNGQKTDMLLGKILRISPKATGGYTVPRSNPFVGQAGKRPQIWAYGLRNPWRFSFDRKTGALIIGDVGDSREEEIDYAPKGGAGANYGWPIWEGDLRNRSGTAKHAVFPVLELSHSDNYCAVIGGYVMRDPKVPALAGEYLFSDLCNSPIMAVKLSPGHATGLKPTGLDVDNATAFGQDSAGHIYVASLEGPVYEIEQSGS